MDQILPTLFGARPRMWIASSRARSQPTCRCRRRPSTTLCINLKTAKALGLDRATVMQIDRQRGDRMRRREFITLLGGAAVAWPLAARAQQIEQIRRVGVLMNLAAEDAEGKRRLRAFAQGLQELGWSEGRNLQIDYRWGAGDADRFRTYAAELVAVGPDVIFATGTPLVEALQHVTRTVPIVFVTVIDPVGSGFVEEFLRGQGATPPALLFSNTA